MAAHQASMRVSEEWERIQRLLERNTIRFDGAVDSAASAAATAVVIQFSISLPSSRQQTAVAVEAAAPKRKWQTTNPLLITNR